MIRFDNVFKFYRITRYRKVILDYVSADFQAGHSYAILGINGAGKSTTMRLIAGMELPNRGRIRRTVRVSWPLGFAGGFHPSMTGRENTYFAARIYGENVRKVVDFVADFAELGPYLDAPIKTYSSGMSARLAFGLSMAIDFDCYLIDEVMGVGDVRFHRRCTEEFTARRARSDMIMISHDMSALQQYCDRGIVLAEGHMHHFDDVNDAIEAYKRANM